MTPTERSLPSDARRSLRIYNLFFPLVFLAMLPGFLLRMFRRGGYREKFGQRFGRFSKADLARIRSCERIWIHSISVGETFVALKLARAIHELDPKIGILLSVTTSTGFAEATKAASEWLEVIYNPLDLRSFVRQTVRQLQPRHLVFIEAVWPNLLAEAVKAGIPTTFIPRVSPRSERRFRRFRALTGPIFRLIDQICVSEAADVDRWESLGAVHARVTCTGSIKFDQTGIQLTRQAEFRALLEPLGVTPQTPIIVGGSTWEPEETVLAGLLPALREKHPGVFLILVPRHVERTAGIMQSLAPLGLRVARRSLLAASVAGNADILLVDATGELREWYGLASVVFIGKSLPGVAEVGGQNPAEPVMLEKPVIFGPHMENFSSLATQFLAIGGATRVQNPAELVDSMAALLSSPDLGAQGAARAKCVLETHTRASARTATLILARTQ